MSELKRTTIRLPPELHKGLKRLAASKDTTITKLIKDAIEEILYKEEQID